MPGRFWLTVLAVPVALLLSAWILHHVYVAANPPVELRPGEEQCIDRTIGTIDDVSKGYSVDYIEKPEFLSFRTESVHAAWFESRPDPFRLGQDSPKTVEVRACVGASESAPSGTYKLMAKYHAGDFAGTLKLEIRVLR